jgi:hypothetical protein
MPRRSGAEYRDVDAWIVAGIVLLACWVWLAGVRRRAAQREAAAKARARARRQRVPLVSANVRGQPAHKPDIWREETEGASQGRPRDA